MRLLQANYQISAISDHPGDLECVGQLCSFLYATIGPLSMLSFFTAFVVCLSLTVTFKRFRRKEFIALAGGLLSVTVTIFIARSLLVPFGNVSSEEAQANAAKLNNQEIEPANDAPSYKPVIYLYPEEIQEVTVKLDYKGELTVTYPRISSEGWKVTAHPGGKLINSSDKKEYSYLFWEGFLPASYYKLPDQGFVVPGEQADTFLQEILSKAGLTAVEYNEFIVFWYPLIKNYPYVQIAFAGEEYDKSAPLSIRPTPDSMLRVFLYFKKLSGKIDLEPQNIPTFERKGFTVVEWGGSIIP